MALAALRKEKGFSQLVREALDAYLESKLAGADKLDKALQLKGSLDTEDADDFAHACGVLREQWR